MSPCEMPGRTGGPAGLAGDAHDAAHPLHDDVERRAVAVGPVWPKPEVAA